MLLDGQVAVITGAAGGIGRGIAERYIEEGASVVIADIDEDAGAATADELGHAAIFSALDVTDMQSINRTHARCIDTFGGVDILVNNAGINVARPVADLTRNEWERVLSINLTGSFLCSQVFARHMIASGRGETILFMSSQAGKRGEAGASAYAASKFGLIGLMECLALELAPHGIRVNAVCPGNVDTRMLDWLLDEIAAREGQASDRIRQQLLDQIPLGRLATTREIADAFVYLASPLASYVSGEAINVDGGELSG